MTAFFVKPGPRNTPEFQRIVNLPQRPAVEIGTAIADVLTDILKTPTGSMVLRPLQALALAEAHDFNGVFVALPVGQGKTIVTYLLPTIMNAKRAVLLVPGALLSKTEHDFKTLSKHWRKHDHYSVVSYEYISTHPEFLRVIQPDLIIADEAHKLKNPKAACTKRVLKYWREKGDVRFVPLSGTLASRSFFDYWHLLVMTLKPGHMTLPYDWKEAELWASALDVKPTKRAALGALRHFGSDLEKARQGYGTFLKNVPGIIAADTTDIAASLIISVDKVTDYHINSNYGKLLKKWELPNGEEICTAPEFYRHARELACGFYYLWKTQPPEYWRMARLNYGRFIRKMLLHSREFEAPSQVDREYSTAYEVKTWKEIEKDFIPETEPVWFSNSVLNEAVSKVGKSGLLWYQHKAVGSRLALDYRIPTFGSKGLNILDGSNIYDCESDIVAVSVKALGEGFNLQKWNRNVIISAPANGRVWEQMLGRTHRSGQEADEITVSYLSALPFRDEDLRKAIDDAKYIASTTAQQQKLTIADIIGLTMEF